MKDIISVWGMPVQRSTCRLLTKTASGVLTSLRGSTYGPEYEFAPSLAAALLDSLSEQPAGHLDSVSHREARPV